MPDQPVNVNVGNAEPAFQTTLSEFARDVKNELRVISTKIDALSPIPAQVADHEHQIREIKDQLPAYVTTAAARWWFSAMVSLVIAAAGIVALVIRQ